MQEKERMQEIVRLVTEAVTQNEIGSDESLKYKFSNASKESGLSFGAVQFDIAHNKMAMSCLRSCDFTREEIDRLLVKTKDLDDLNAKLLAASEIVDSFDRMHITESVDHCVELCEGSVIEMSCTESMVNLVDYHNQYWMTPGGKIHTWLREQGKPVTPEMMLAFRLDTLWGKKRPDDVNRRHENIKRICAKPLQEGVCHDRDRA